MGEKGKELKVFDVNGREVGTIISTGDDMEDTRLAHQIFEQLGLSGPELTKEGRIFEQAVSFYKAAHVLYELVGSLQQRAKYFIAPLTVNITFAIELHLKALIAAHGLDLRGHNLADLFSALPTHVIAGIQDVAGVAAADHGLAGDIELRPIFVGISDAFVRWRYAYEFEANHFSIKHAMFVLDVLNRYAKAHIDRTK